MASVVAFVKVDGSLAAINPWFMSLYYQDFPWPFVRCFVNIANSLGALLWISLFHQFVVIKVVDSDTVWVSFRIIKAPPASFCFDVVTIMCIFITFYFTCLFINISLLLMDLLMEGKVKLKGGFWLMLLGIFLWAWATRCLLLATCTVCGLKHDSSHRVRSFSPFIEFLEGCPRSVE